MPIAPALDAFTYIATLEFFAAPMTVMPANKPDIFNGTCYTCYDTRVASNHVCDLRTDAQRKRDNRGQRERERARLQPHAAVRHAPTTAGPAPTTATARPTYPRPMPMTVTERVRKHRAKQWAQRMVSANAGSRAVSQAPPPK